MGRHVFLNPLLLAGAALAAIPIVLHLAMRQSPRRYQFPALRFVQPRHEANRRRLRLRHLLLLALRMALVVMLAVALARPTVRSSGAWGTAEQPVAAALVFDTSPRMDYQYQGRSRLEAARELARWIVARLPRESQIAVVDCRPIAAAFQVDRGAALDQIGRLETQTATRSLPDRILEAARLLESSPLDRREMFVFTDLTQAAWPRGAGMSFGQVADQGRSALYLIDVGVDRPVNTALGDLDLSGQVLPVGATLRVSAEVQHRGPGTTRTVELFVYEAPTGATENTGQPQSRGKQNASLAEGKRQQVEFHLATLTAGMHHGYVEIAEPDGLACDNRRYFTVQVRPPWPVLIAAPEPAEQYAFFLREMLAPTTLVQLQQSQFECQVVGLGELEKADPTPFAAVLLVDPPRLPAEVWRKLYKYVADGGGLAVFLGRNAAAIEAFNADEPQRLLAGKLLRPARRPDGITLAPVRLEHPILAALRPYERQLPWQTGPVFRYWQLELPASGVQVVVPFSDGQPAVLERLVGEGRAVTVVTPLSDPASENPWNLLPSGECWPCLAMINQLASYLTGSGAARWNYAAGQTVALRLEAGNNAGNSYRVEPLGGGGDEAFVFRSSTDPGSRLLTLTAPERLGNYRVLSGAAGKEYGFSINLPAEQTRFDRLSDEDLAERLGQIRFRLARSREEIELSRNVQQAGRELFAEVILLVALLLAGEHVLANRFYGRISPAGGSPSSQ